MVIDLVYVTSDRLFNLVLHEVNSNLIRIIIFLAIDEEMLIFRDHFFIPLPHKVNFISNLPRELCLRLGRIIQMITFEPLSLIHQGILQNISFILSDKLFFLLHRDVLVNIQVQTVHTDQFPCERLRHHYFRANISMES